MPLLKFDLSADLTEFLQHRALRTGRTIQQTLEALIRETQTYDSLVAKMSQAPQLPRGEKPRN